MTTCWRPVQTIILALGVLWLAFLFVFTIYWVPGDEVRLTAQQLAVDDDTRPQYVFLEGRGGQIIAMSFTVFGPGFVVTEGEQRKTVPFNWYGDRR